jgi:hypothetical protein
MSKLLSNIIFSFFLLFQTISLADEESQDENIETNITEQSSEENSEAQDELSEAQKEALAAELAELSEAGIDEEPVAK